MDIFRPWINGFVFSGLSYPTKYKGIIYSPGITYLPWYSGRECVEHLNGIIKSAGEPL